MPDVPGDARIVAIANQKGGVGKSTTAVSLGAALADVGYRVLVVDLDPQGNASTGLGIRHEARGTTVYDVIVGDRPIDEAVVGTQVAGLYGVPSTIDLAGAEIELVSQFSREGRLKKAIEPIRTGSYDFVLLDCPPSLGLLTVNALTAAEELIVPIQCEYYALEGLGQLLRNVGLVQQNINPELRLTGIVMTMFDPRTKLSEQVVDEVRRHFGDLVYDVVIPRTVRLSEAPGYGQPITVYDPKSRGAETYRELAREVALRPPPEGPMPSFEDLPDVVSPRIPDDDVTPTPDGEGPTSAAGPAVEEIEDEAQEQPSDPAPGEAEPAPPPPGSATDPEPKATDPEPEATDPEPEATDPEPEADAPEPEADAPEPEADAPEPEADAVIPELDVDAGRVAEAQAPLPPAGSGAVLEPLEAEPEVEHESSPLPRSEGRDLAEAIWEDESPPPPRVRPARPPQERGPTPRRVVVIDDDADLEAVTKRRAREGSPPPEPEGDDEGVAPIGATLEDDGAPRRRWRLFRKGGEG